MTRGAVGRNVPCDTLTESSALLDDRGGGTEDGLGIYNDSLGL